MSGVSSLYNFKMSIKIQFVSALTSMCWNMYGWLQIFFSCIMVFIKVLAPPLPFRNNYTDENRFNLRLLWCNIKYITIYCGSITARATVFKLEDERFNSQSKTRHGYPVNLGVTNVQKAPEIFFQCTVYDSERSFFFPTKNAGPL